MAVKGGLHRRAIYNCNRASADGRFCIGLYQAYRKMPLRTSPCIVGRKTARAQGCVKSIAKIAQVNNAVTISLPVIRVPPSP